MKTFIIVESKDKENVFTFELDFPWRLSVGENLFLNELSNCSKTHLSKDHKDLLESIGDFEILKITFGQDKQCFYQAVYVEA